MKTKSRLKVKMLIRLLFQGPDLHYGKIGDIIINNPPYIPNKGDEYGLCWAEFYEDAVAEKLEDYTAGYGSIVSEKTVTQCKDHTFIHIQLSNQTEL